MTIEERACAYVKTGNHVIGSVWHAYIQGATDQKKIDTEKACEALYIIQDELNADLMDIEKAKEIMCKNLRKNNESLNR